MPEKGCIILCRTSNEGAGEIQDLMTYDFNPRESSYMHMEELLQKMEQESMPLYQRVARNVAEEWNTLGNCALVVGATYPEELRIVRDLAPDLPLLIPGIGAQGGDLEAVVKNGMDRRSWGVIINSSRGIIHKSSGEDFAQAARQETERLTQAINRYRSKHIKN